MVVAGKEPILSEIRNPYMQPFGGRENPNAAYESDTQENGVQSAGCGCMNRMNGMGNNGAVNRGNGMSTNGNVYAPYRPQNNYNTCPQRPDQKRSMQTVYELGFAMTETALFLDTHPNDAEALEYYMDMKKKYQDAVCYYNDNFGPLDFCHVTNENYWSWVATPMPWEVED